MFDSKTEVYLDARDPHSIYFDPKNPGHLEAWQARLKQLSPPLSPSSELAGGAAGADVEHRGRPDPSPAIPVAGPDEVTFTDTHGSGWTSWWHGLYGHGLGISRAAIACCALLFVGVGCVLYSYCSPIRKRGVCSYCGSNGGAFKSV